MWSGAVARSAVAMRFGFGFGKGAGACVSSRKASARSAFHRCAKVARTTEAETRRPSPTRSTPASAARHKRCCR